MPARSMNGSCRAATTNGRSFAVPGSRAYVLANADGALSLSATGHSGEIAGRLSLLDDPSREPV
jgi:hypothetical protein